MEKKILVVEDNPQNMRLIEMVLGTKGGYTLLKATDGEQALDIATKERPDLILMDIQLPKLDGLEVTRQLKATPALSHIPVIALTAYAMKGDRERLIDGGCDFYMSKPFDIYELSVIVAEMLGHQREAKD